jgi:Fe-S oxidoreductase
MARLPRLANLLSTNALSRWVLKRLGLVDIPAVSTTSLDAALRARGVARVEVGALIAGGRVSAPDAGARPLVFLLDAFTTYYEPHIVLAAVEVGRLLGRDVRVLGFEPSGKGAHVKGFLGRFSTQARRWRAILAGLDGADVVGLDPAVVLVFRDELPHALGEAAPTTVSLLQEWLEAAAFPAPAAKADGSYTLFAHCTERTAAPKTNALWKKIFAKAGLRLDVESVGCCGMCGAFGHEARHEAESRGIYDLSWRPHLAKVGDRSEPLATGYSCRSQVKRCEGRSLRHPIEVLAARLRAAP